MVSVISDEIRKARKEYHCDSSEFVRECDSLYLFSFSEKRQIAKAKANNWKIKKGDSYRHQVNKYDGILYEYRCIPEIHTLCIKYDLYPDV